ATQTPPRPVVVAIDPGHGGSVNPANPSQLYDPGAIGANGVQEKDVTLDVARKLARLLQADEVRTVLARTDDTYVTIPQREQVAIDNGASEFLSIHVNSYRDPSVGGSLVLYPNDNAKPFALAVSRMLGEDLGAQHIANGGVQLRDNWWIHAPMPTATAEIAYLTNPREAALMATDAFRAQVAAALRDGIEKFDPQIAARRAQIRAWRAQHPGQPIATPHPRPQGNDAAPVAHTSSPLGTLLLWVLAIGGVLALLRWPRLAVWLVVGTITLVLRTILGVVVHRNALRRRRRQRTRRAASSARPHSVYDELWL
ncbi:MAG TPA: N-acetylmuramoyl-L-alanine amidase, partial [Candidatus Dormibacteraeota bacterium]|nr:N-acetylmuramoyl-L-alanine amidase [Candidatus Dormibacteraeota bacterium]